MSNDNPWWYYMMGYEDAKRPSREVGAGMFVFMLVLFIIGLVLFGAAVAVLIWVFFS